jgi:predicted DNA-binding protein YlxM (UPF0122 family)
MALTEKQLECIEYLVEGTLKKIEIAEKINVTKQTVYNWLKNEEFQAELDRRVNFQISDGDKKIKIAFPKVVEELVNLALSPKTEVRTKNNACQYIINRVLGSPANTTNMEITDNTTDDKTDVISEFEKMFAKKSREEISEQLKNTVLHRQLERVSAQS